MNYCEFREEVKKQLRSIAGEQMRIKIQKIQKNNGICLDGISIWKEGENVSPTIYLDHFYESFQAGENIKAIAQGIMELYEMYRIEEPIDPDFYRKFSNICSYIACKVINYEKNQELLKDIPYIRYLNLAVVFYCSIKNERIGKGTILIHNSHLKFWDVSASELAAIARENMQQQLQYEFADMMDMIQDYAEDGEEHLSEQGERMPMYVLTNQEKHLGAICIVYDTILNEIGQKLKEDYYILPSSIHECIIVPKRKEIDPDELRIMVREINDNQVHAEEVLSDEIYQYERRYHRLSIVLPDAENYPFLETEIEIKSK